MNEFIVQDRSEEKPLSLEKPVFRCFLFYAGLIIDRTLLMKILTMNNRVAHAVGLNTASSIAVGITDDNQLRAHSYCLGCVAVNLCDLYQYR